MGTKEAKKHSKEKAKKDSDSDSSDSEHELSYYINDRIKLMQQVLGLIKPKKIISMAPNTMKDIQPSSIKSLLLEELLGISNKRLRSILAGENLNDDTSSDSQIDKDESAEVISLDDITDGSEIYISDDNTCMEIQLSERERLELEIENPGGTKSKRKLTDKGKNKNNLKEVVVKKEKKKKHKKKTVVKEEKTEDITDEPVVNVLNLLELQARARAIRSQLASEVLVNTELSQLVEKPLINVNDIKKSKSDDEGDDSDSVICISPQNVPVVMIQSNSEPENDDTKQEKITIKGTQDEKTINSNDEDYNNDVLIVTEDDITLDKDSVVVLEEDKVINHPGEDDSSTWKSRWLESKKVKDVLKTTKLYNSLRQKRKQKRTDSEEQETDAPEICEDNTDDTSTKETEEVEGSKHEDSSIPENTNVDTT